METQLLSKPAFFEHIKNSPKGISDDLRLSAEKALHTLPLPTSKDEFWKYTRLNQLNKIQFKTTAPSGQIPKGILSSSIRLVFENGVPTSKLPDHLPEGLNLQFLSELSAPLETTKLAEADELFSALNTAHLHGGILVSVNEQLAIDTTLELIHIVSGAETLSNFKSVFSLGKGSSLKVVEVFLSSEEAVDCLVNHSMEVDLAANSHLELTKIQYESEANFSVSNEYIDQEKDSTYTQFTLTLNGKLVRNNIFARINGSNAVTNLFGASVCGGQQHVDHHTCIDHRVPHCQSNELYKGVMDQQSTGVFNGKVYVRKDAQKINAFQSNANVLLSADAKVYSKPELEIYADDVKCSHGSTTGQLDDEAVFYLQSRGISKSAAERLLVEAFIADVLDRIENNEVRTYVDTCLKERYGWN